MNQKELKELIEFLIEKDIAEFELERGDVKLRSSAEPNSRACPTRDISRCIQRSIRPPNFLPPSQPRWNSAQLPRLLLNPKSICTS